MEASTKRVGSCHGWKAPYQPYASPIPRAGTGGHSAIFCPCQVDQKPGGQPAGHRQRLWSRFLPSVSGSLAPQASKTHPLLCSSWQASWFLLPALVSVGSSGPNPLSPAVRLRRTQEASEGPSPVWGTLSHLHWREMPLPKQSPAMRPTGQVSPGVTQVLEVESPLTLGRCPQCLAHIWYRVGSWWGLRSHPLALAVSRYGVGKAGLPPAP